MKELKNQIPPIGGLINFRKPVGPGSMQIIRQLRRLLHVKKIGHVGTLDPFADGVLPIAVGRATNMIQYMENDTKVYRVLFYFGESTDTQDLSGKIIRQTELTPQWVEDLLANDMQRLRSAVSAFTGTLEQDTPQYSAAKIDGKPMYAYARQGIEVQGKKRTIEVLSADIVGVAFVPACFTDQHVLPDVLPGDQYFPGLVLEKGLDEEVQVHETALSVVVDIHCSKGSYIRTWVNDLGEYLGVGAYAARLRRMRSGAFNFADSVTWEELQQKYEKVSQSAEVLAITDEYLREETKIQSVLLSVDRARPDIPVLELDEKKAREILQGKRPKASKERIENGIYRLYYSDRFLGLGRVVEQATEQKLYAERMFISLEDFTNRS